MVECAELMCHGVAYAEEGVGKSHTCHSSGIAHLFTCYRVIGAVIICSRKIFKYHLKSANCNTVGVIGSHYRSISLKAMCNGVDT